MCAALQAEFSRTLNVRPVFIRMNIPTFTKPLTLPYEHTMYDETVVVELEKSEEEILAGMSQSGRRSLRNATKNNVDVTELTKDKSAAFKKECYPILKETGARDGFGIHPLSLYTALLESLPNNARLYVAKVNKKIEAWAITTEYNTLGMYYYGGSSHAARTSDAAYKLHWDIMMAMKQRGNLTYDFMGIAGKHYSGLKNVTQFKIKFSKNIVSIPVTYDLPLQPLKYTLLSIAVKLKRSLKK
jgi:lipid II:glycine glycyltransferase (peptidoglycan interpeptide bridge formation enzyme)